MRNMLRILSVSVLLAIPALAADEAKKDGWASEVAVGYHLSSGNSDIELLDLKAGSQRKTPKHETLLSAGYSYGESEDVKNVETGSASAQQNYLFSERTFAFLKAELSRDDIADIEYRLLAGPGLGYYLIKSDNTSLAVEGGASYLREKVGGETDDTADLRLAQRGEHKLSETAKIWESVEYLPEFEDFGAYLLNAEAGAEAALNSYFSLRVTVEDKYDSEPAPDREENDVAVKAALVFKI